MNARPLNLDSWARKEHFEFFSQFDEPFFGVTINVDCGSAYKKCKEHSISFFSYYLHKTLLAANAVEPFRYRTDGSQVWIYDRIDASPTIMRPDGTFGFGLVEFQPNFELFAKSLEIEVARVTSVPNLFTRDYPDNLLHISALPWLDFTAISHARRFGKGDSCPKISFGKLNAQPNGAYTMPVSIHVHHGLIDALHVAQFTEIFTREMGR